MNVLNPFKNIVNDIADRVEISYFARKYDRNQRRANKTIKAGLIRQMKNEK